MPPGALDLCLLPGGPDRALALGNWTVWWLSVVHGGY